MATNSSAIPDLTTPPGQPREFRENLIFLRQHPERGEELALNVAEMETLRHEADNVSEALWASADPLGQYRHFKTIFCSAADCRTLKNATMARLAWDASPTSSLASDI